MWLETSIWLWAPLAGVFGAWTVRHSLMVERELRRLRERVAELEAAHDSARRITDSRTRGIRDGRTSTRIQRLSRNADDYR